MSTPVDPQSIRHVVLPDGKTIEVLFVGSDPVAPAPAVRPAHPTELHVCPACASDLVMPVTWEEAGALHWDVTLHCPNCDWYGGGVFDEASIERLDEALDRGTEALVEDLHRLVRANMEDQIDRFVAALTADALLPEDF